METRVCWALPQVEGNGGQGIEGIGPGLQIADPRIVRDGNQFGLAEQGSITLIVDQIEPENVALSASALARGSSPMYLPPPSSWKSISHSWSLFRFEGSGQTEVGGSPLEMALPGQMGDVAVPVRLEGISCAAPMSSRPARRRWSRRGWRRRRKGSRPGGRTRTLRPDSRIQKLGSAERLFPRSSPWSAMSPTQSPPVLP